MSWAPACAALVLALALPLQPARATASPGGDVEPAAAWRALDGDTRDTVAGVWRWVARVFAVPADLALDAELRAAAEGMAERHLQQMRNVLAGWVLEARASHGGSPSQHDVHQRLVARYVNQLALWQLERSDAAHDERWLAVLAHPGVCEPPKSGGAGYFSLLVQRWQHVPAAQRESFLAAERSLLERFGRPEPQPVGLALSPEELAKPLERPSAYEARPVRDVLREPPRPPDALPLRCAQAQARLGSAMSVAPAGGASALDRRQWLAEFRAATAPQIGDFQVVDLAVRLEDGYPKMGQRFGVTGRSRVRYWVDGEGRVLRAQVLGHRLRADGVPGRPVAFEAIFDYAALLQLQHPSLRQQKPSPAHLKEGLAAREVEMVWMLD